MARGQRREYKVLQFEFQMVQEMALKNKGDNERHIDLTASSKRNNEAAQHPGKRGLRSS
jgi:hypothetical protein